MIRFFVGSAVALAASFGAAGGQARPAIAGWLLSIISGFAGICINLRTVGAQGRSSVMVGLVAHVLRAVFLLVAMLMLWRTFGDDGTRFVAATLAAYFVTLAVEVARLARIGLKG